MTYNRNTAAASIDQASVFRSALIWLAALGAIACSNAFASDDAKKVDAPGKDAEAPSDGTAAAKPPGTPVPRKILFPPLTLQAKEGGAFVPVEFGAHRYTVVVLCASWDERSKVIAEAANAEAASLEKIRIGVVLALSHDTWESVSPWFAKMKPVAPTGVAGVELQRSFKNPKVPAFWVVASDGRIIDADPAPTEASLRAVIAKLRSWTEF